MADQDPEKDSLYKEIDEELRHENYAKLWKKYGNFIIATAALVIVSVAAYQGWNAYSVNKRSDDSALYTTALEALKKDNKDQALSILTRLSNNASKAYATLSQLNKASINSESGNIAEASASYLLIANDSSESEIFRDLAVILWTMHNMNSIDPVKLTKDLQRLILPSNPWRHTAKELVALIAKRNGNTKQANRLFEELADDVTAPAGIRSRASELLSISGE